jgi:hypothetical protein
MVSPITLETVFHEVQGLKESLAIPTYLKVDKAAAYLNTSENALRVMCSKGQIKYIKKQNKLFFRLSDLIEWFESGSSDIIECDIEDLMVPTTKKGAQPRG